jgi:hypothetical protein
MKDFELTSEETKLLTAAGYSRSTYDEKQVYLHESYTSWVRLNRVGEMTQGLKMNSVDLTLEDDIELTSEEAQLLLAAGFQRSHHSLDQRYQTEDGVTWVFRYPEGWSLTSNHKLYPTLDLLTVAPPKVENFVLLGETIGSITAKAD